MFMASSSECDGNRKLEDRLDVLTQMVVDISVRLSNACVYVPMWAGTVWAESGTSKADSRAGKFQSVLATSPTDYVSSASFVDTGAGKADDIPLDVPWRSVAEGGDQLLMQADMVEVGADEADGIIENAFGLGVAEGGDPFSIQAASVCDGCWEMLPETCRCGVVRWCRHCADIFMGVGGKAEHGEGTGEVTMDMVRLELQRMAANVERFGSLGHGLGGLGDMVREMHGRLDEVREQMATRDVYDSLLDRLRQLEGGIGSSTGAGFVEQGVFDEHSGYSEDEGDVSDYGNFDGDGNYIESEDQHAEWDG